MSPSSERRSGDDERTSRAVPRRLSPSGGTAAPAVRVAVVGVGNCASSFVQALQAAHQGRPLPGLTHERIGSYGPRDVDVVAAFDVDERKVGLDLAEAICAAPNCTTTYQHVPTTGVRVAPGPLLDGVSQAMKEVVRISPAAVCGTPGDVAAVLRDTGVEVLAVYLPVGSVAAAAAYAEAAVVAGCSLVNFTPAPLASSDRWAERFRQAGKPLLGDDTRSQVGSTVVHRSLLTTLLRSGVEIHRSHQLNVGGNTDFRNMGDPGRGNHKVRTKLAALHQLLPDGGAPLSAGPSGHVPHLLDTKVSHISIEGVGPLGMPVSLEVRLQVEDSPNTALVTLDAVRAAKAAEDQGIAGPVPQVCAQLFKNPPVPMGDDEAGEAFDRFAAVTASQPAAVPATRKGA